MRIEGWEASLAEYLAQAHSVQFAWGKNDCALWVGQWLKIATGVAHVDTWAATYKTEMGAARRLRKLGFSDVSAVMTNYLPQVSPSLARRGDLVLHPAGAAAGICNGRQSHFLMAEGCATHPTLECLKAWRVE